MVRTDPPRFAALLDQVDDLKTKPTAAEAIVRAYGVTPDALYARWRRAGE
jgi:hypothetical protein